MWEEARRVNHVLAEVLSLTSPSSSSTSRKSKSLKTLNCCSEVVSSMLSGSRVPSSEDTRLGWCSMRSSSPQLEKITYTEKQRGKHDEGPFFNAIRVKISSHCDDVARLTEGFFVSPTSCPHKDKTFTSFSRVLFCRGREEMETLWAKLGCHNLVSLKPRNNSIPNQVSRGLSQELAV